MLTKKAKKSKIVRIALLAFTIYVLVSLIFVNSDIKNREKGNFELQAQIEKQTILNQEVQEIIDAGADSDYIIKMAREKLGFVFPNERVYVDISGK